VQTSEPQGQFGEEPGFPIKLAVNERGVLESVSAPVLTFRLERVSLSGARGQQREFLLEGYCEEQGTRKRCPRAMWIRLSDEEGHTPKSTGTNETNIERDPGFDFTASVRASSRRFLMRLEVAR
jgi:hypothetical protein